MEPLLQRRVQRYGWDKASAYYENYWHRQLKPAQDLLMEMAALQPGEKVIDIACGTGLISFRAAEKVGTNGYILGTDISDKMVERATALASEKNISNIKFERMDAEELTVADAGFDVGLCALGLMYVTDAIKALKEMNRVLKPGGHAVAAVWGQRINCGWAEIFEIVDKRVSSEVCPMFFNLGNKNVLQLNFEAAGFNEVATERLTTSLHYDTDEEACGAAFEGGPVALAYHKFSENIKEEARQEYIASIMQYKNETGYDVPGEFVIARAKKL